MHKKTKQRKSLTVQQKIQIVHQVLVEHQRQADVAAEHKISTKYVSALCVKAQKNKQFIDEIMSKRD